MHHGQHPKPRPEHTKQWRRHTWIRKFNTSNLHLSLVNNHKIPTVLLVLGSTNAEIIRVHARYPLLALFLSVTNINKRPDHPQQDHARLQTTTSISLGPYGVVQQRKPSSSVSRASAIGIWVVHILAALGAAIVIWNTVEIGRNGVMSWACWTDFYPVVWIGMAVLHHVLTVVCMRASLGVERTKVLVLPARGKSQPRRQTYTSSPSSFALWDLTHPDLLIKVKRRKFAKWSKAATDLVNNVNYLYGTAVFTSLTLVSGRVAIQKMAWFGIITVAARIAVVWVLEDIEGEE